jgi:hypothetical protein
MVIERFRPNAMQAVYERFATRGRLLPAGLHYIDSWLSSEREVCYQLMETGDPSLFDQWIAQWSDLVDFEIVPLDN